MTYRLGAAVFAAFASCAAPTLAQDYPNKTVTIVVPFGAGGTTDVLGRLLADRLGQRLGQRFIVENKAGASGNTGVAFVAKAPADGYTLTMGTVSTHAINPNVFAKLPFDPVKDFAPISLVALVPNVLLANNALPAKDVPELIRLLKANPGKYSFASSGPGTSTHMAGELFKLMSGTDMAHVPYRSSAAVVQDLMGGQVQVTFDNITIALPQVQAGNIKMLATATEKRLSVAPDVPTVAEFLPSFTATSWHAFFAPAATPPDIVAKLSVEVQAILKEPAVMETLAKLGVDPVGSDGPTLAAHITTEMKRWGDVAEKAKIRIE